MDLESGLEKCVVGNSDDSKIDLLKEILDLIEAHECHPPKKRFVAELSNLTFRVFERKSGPINIINKE